MIDNPDKAIRLLSELAAVMPLEARVGPELAATWRDKVPGLQPQQPCRITDVHYAGSEGGIVCLLDLAGGAEDEAFAASITLLAFDRRLPLAREIAAYQKHRRKRIRRAAAAMISWEVN